MAVYEPGVFDVPNDANPVDATETARTFTEAVAAGRLADAGHFAPILAPMPIARELARFFTAEPQPA